MLRLNTTALDAAQRAAEAELAGFGLVKRKQPLSYCVGITEYTPFPYYADDKPSSLNVIASWVASATLRRVDDNLRVKPNALAARAAVLAFGDELVDQKLNDNVDSLWLSQGSREMAAAYLLPRAEAEDELQRLADAVKRASQGQSSPSSGSRAL